LSAANSSAEWRLRDPRDAPTIDLVSHSSLHTERLGERLGRSARPNDVFALWGELGTGKTVLARGVASGLGLEPDAISSPTFIILREHGGGRMPLFHVDLYRLEGADLVNTGWEECLEAGGVTVIEWPDRAGAVLPADRLDVRLEHISDTKRSIVISATGRRSARLVEELRASVIGA
jgi:tRNA threonylcarbamoyladenosine biosynthesis protein TsaE